MKICSVVECTKPVRRNGMCPGHSAMAYRRGKGATFERLRTEHGFGRPVTAAGYVLITVDGIRIYEHRYIAEKALGKKLPPGAVVHHINGDPQDNRPYNLVICPDQAYHMLLERRTKGRGLS